MTKYVIPSEKLSFIHDHFFQWSFGKPADFLPSKQAFAQLNHPAELHYLALIYNWDDRADVLLWILESPHCARSTANLLFWRSLPSYFEDSDFSDASTCPEFCEPGFIVCRSVLMRYKRMDFSPIDLSFDPTKEWEPLRRENPFWSAPEGVFDKIRGLEVYA